MNTYAGLFIESDTNKQWNATVVLLPKVISIGITDTYGNVEVLQWPYKDLERKTYLQQGDSVITLPENKLKYLQVPGAALDKELQEKLKEKDRFILQRLFGKRYAAVWKALLIMAVLFLLFYLFVIPWISVQVAKSVSVRYEEKLGNGIYSVVMQGYTKDTAETRLVNDFFNEMDITTPYHIDITVVESGIANAFALPGGRIVVFSALLDKMNGYEELAALLAHEFTHVQNKHTTKSLFRALGNTFFFSMIFGNMGTVANIIVNNADRIKSLKYSRSLEKEADLDGLQLLSERQIDCNGFVKLFRLLQQEQTKIPAEWLSSHPDLERRMAYVKEDEQFNKKGVAPHAGLDSIFKAVKGLRQ
jgi:beta-barrel assembly-enhancing protease